MSKLVLMGLFVLALSTSGTARADLGQGQGQGQGQDQGQGHKHDGDCDKDDVHCQPPTRPVCFNLVCYYKAKDHDQKFHECKAATTFIKNVSIDGGEVDDVSGTPPNTNPQLAVSCDDNPNPVFNNSSYRATDLLGTVIQAQQGPTPSIRIPRGELHTGPDNNIGGEHVSPSELLIDTNESAHDDVQRMEGKCYIWTGNP